MATGHSLRTLGEVINYHQNARVVVVCGASFKMVILDQLKTQFGFFVGETERHTVCHVLAGT